MNSQPLRRTIPSQEPLTAARIESMRKAGWDYASQERLPAGDAMRGELGELGANQYSGLCITKPSLGTGAEYLTARLARDHANIKAALDRGEFPSVRSAARAAGLVRRPPAVGDGSNGHPHETEFLGVSNDSICHR